jgi:hypothetical protein
MMQTNSPKLWLLVFALAVLAGLLAPPVPAAGQQVSVRVNEPFEVGGQYFMSGELSLREVREYSPVATLTEVRVDGHSLGVVLARNQADQTNAATRNEVIFERSERGHLVLASVALRGEPVRLLYRLGNGDNAGQWVALSHRQPGLRASMQ